MRRRRIRRLALAVLVWVLALAVLPQTVLCIGVGGHVAVEAVSALCCPRPEAADHGLSGEADCPPHCSDSPVGFTVATHDPKSPTAPPVLVTFDFISLLAGTVADSGLASSLFVEVGPPPLPPRDLRTTIHRC